MRKNLISTTYNTNNHYWFISGKFFFFNNNILFILTLTIYSNIKLHKKKYVKLFFLKYNSKVLFQYRRQIVILLMAQEFHLTKTKK